MVLTVKNAWSGYDGTNPTGGYIPMVGVAGKNQKNPGLYY